MVQHGGGSIMLSVTVIAISSVLQNCFENKNIILHINVTVTVTEYQMEEVFFLLSG